MAAVEIREIKLTADNRHGVMRFSKTIKQYCYGISGFKLNFNEDYLDDSVGAFGITIEAHSHDNILALEANPILSTNSRGKTGRNNYVTIVAIALLEDNPDVYLFNNLPSPTQVQGKYEKMLRIPAIESFMVEFQQGKQEIIFAYCDSRTHYSSSNPMVAFSCQAEMGNEHKKAKQRSHMLGGMIFARKEGPLCAQELKMTDGEDGLYLINEDISDCCCMISRFALEYPDGAHRVQEITVKFSCSAAYHGVHIAATMEMHDSLGHRTTKKYPLEGVVIGIKNEESK